MMLLILGHVLCAPELLLTGVLGELGNGWMTALVEEEEEDDDDK